MKRFLLLSLMALPLFVVSCDREIPNEPTPVVDDGALLKEVTIQGAPSNNVKFGLRCAKGVGGGITYKIYNANEQEIHAGGAECNQAAVGNWASAAKVSAVFYLTGGSGACFSAAPNGIVNIPARLKCPSSGKADGVASFSYTK